MMDRKAVTRNSCSTAQPGSAGMDDEISPVAALVAAAAAGDQTAWRELVERYAPLLVTVVRRFRLSPAET